MHLMQGELQLAYSFRMQACRGTQLLRFPRTQGQSCAPDVVTSATPTNPYEKRGQRR